MSYRIYQDGSVEANTIDEALALRERLRQEGLLDDDAKKELNDLRNFAQAIRDRFPGVGLDEIPSLIGKILLSTSDQVTRVNLNYWRSRAQELAEEVIIWKRRAEKAEAPAIPLPPSHYAPEPPQKQAQPQTEAPAAPPVAAEEPKHDAPNMAKPKAEIGDDDPDELDDGDDEPAEPLPPPPKRTRSCFEERGHVAKTVRAIRRQLGISQLALAKRVGVPQTKISQLETERCNCPPDLLAKIQEQAPGPRPGARESGTRGSLWGGPGAPSETPRTPTPPKPPRAPESHCMPPAPKPAARIAPAAGTASFGDLLKQREDLLKKESERLLGTRDPTAFLRSR